MKNNGLLKERKGVPKYRSHYQNTQENHTQYMQRSNSINPFEKKKKKHKYISTITYTASCFML
jgi:hypothetical protein